MLHFLSCISYIFIRIQSAIRGNTGGFFFVFSIRNSLSSLQQLCSPKVLGERTSKENNDLILKHRSHQMRQTSAAHLLCLLLLHIELSVAFWLPFQHSSDRDRSRGISCESEVQKFDCIFSRLDTLLVSILDKRSSFTILTCLFSRLLPASLLFHIRSSSSSIFNDSLFESFPKHHRRFRYGKQRSKYMVRMTL